MKNTVLVTYASKHGSTAEVAEKIAEVLSTSGIKTEVHPVVEVNDLQKYNIVVLGSAVYIGKWRKEAVHFLKKRKQELASKNVWIFSTGPTGEGDPVELLKGWKYPDSLKTVIEEIDPEDITVFHGAVDESKLNKMEKMAIKMVKAPVGDFRDWKAVQQWAAGIVKEIGLEG
jgi:menaquinone-dependent protoporphyrinogen oxidase